jgi:large subunit ribosomal protein L10
LLASRATNPGGKIPKERRETPLAITKQRKDELVEQYADLLERTSGFVIIEYRGLSVKAIDELRAKIREVQGQYIVTKNTLFTKALQQKEWVVPDDLLQGPTAVAFALDNFPAVAKVVLEYVDNRERENKASVKGGVMTGTVLDSRRVEAISKLPPLDELRSQLAGLIAQPATGLVSVLNAATGQVVNVINAYVQENSGENDAA